MATLHSSCSNFDIHDGQGSRSFVAKIKAAIADGQDRASRDEWESASVGGRAEETAQDRQLINDERQSITLPEYTKERVK